MALTTSVPAGGESLSGFVLSLMGITEGGYRYTEDLLALESQQAHGCPSYPSCCHITATGPMSASRPEVCGVHMERTAGRLSCWI